MFISSVVVENYVFSFHEEGTVWVHINDGRRRNYSMIWYELCDPYTGREAMDPNMLVPFDARVKHEWLKVCPHMKYAYEKCGDVVTADKLAMIAYVNKYPCLEPLLNNPHNKEYRYFTYMWNNTCDCISMYERMPHVLKQVVRNFHDATIDLHMFIPLSEAHEPQYRWARDMVSRGCVDGIVLSELSDGEFTVKDMNYVIKLHKKAPKDFRLDEEWIALESYVNYRRMLKDVVNEGILPGNVLDDPYWVYPSPAQYYNRRDRIDELLTNHYDSLDSHEDFDECIERYARYPVDIEVGGYRFYTTTSRERWIDHSDALKQCCYKARYYTHENNILTFVEKDGMPYGTIDYSLVEHRVVQARVDQTVYSESDMPLSTVALFNKHVAHMLNK